MRMNGEFRIRFAEQEACISFFWILNYIFKDMINTFEELFKQIKNIHKSF